MARRHGRTLALFLSIAVAEGVAAAPRVIESYTPVEGLLRIGPEPHRAIPMTERGFTLVVPEGDVRGVLFLAERGARRVEDPSDPPGGLHDLCMADGIAVLHHATGDPLDFYFGDTTDRVAREIETILVDHGLDGTPLVFMGMSLAGTRALKLAEHLVANDDAFWIEPRAVAMIDPPLDMVRFARAKERAAALELHPIAADEARWVLYRLETHLGGSLDEARDAYVAYSPFVYGEPGGGNARHLVDVPVRVYHEPDVNWWIEHRGQSYYSMNSIDAAALVQELRTMGNEHAELVTTHNRRDGWETGSHPHTHTMVDEADLVRWFVGHLSKEPSRDPK